MNDQRTPRTEAGRALDRPEAHWTGCQRRTYSEKACSCGLTGDILAIEAESHGGSSLEQAEQSGPKPEARPTDPECPVYFPNEGRMCGKPLGHDDGIHGRTPRTEAGRRLLLAFEADLGTDPTYDVTRFAQSVSDIEAEAAREARAALEAIRDLPGDSPLWRAFEIARAALQAEEMTP